MEGTALRLSVRRLSLGAAPGMAANAFPEGKGARQKWRETGWARAPTPSDPAHPRPVRSLAAPRPRACAEPPNRRGAARFERLRGARPPWTGGSPASPCTAGSTVPSRPQVSVRHGGTPGGCCGVPASIPAWLRSGCSKIQLEASFHCFVPT